MSPFAWTVFKENVTIDKDFAISLADELKKNNIISGTILLVANEISLKPPFFFSYNNEFEVRFPGRYTLILVADRFDSPQGGKIDLTGARASNGTDGTNGVDGEDSPSLNTFGGFGHPGNPPHATAGDGNNIKIFCNQLGNRLVPLEIISNGGIGGAGGTGGNGGVGGLEFDPESDTSFQASGGAGGAGGAGGPGGRGGIIQVFCNQLVNLGIYSNGGSGGSGGSNGGSNVNRRGAGGTGGPGGPGGRGGNGGIGGNGGRIEVLCNKLENSDLRSNGGSGGSGGRGGNGGSSVRNLRGGDGARGGNGGIGGNGGRLKVRFDTIPEGSLLSDQLRRQSNGGNRGGIGIGGGGGSGHGGSGNTGAIGDLGSFGTAGAIDVEEAQFTLRQVWGEVVKELRIPSG